MNERIKELITQAGFEPHYEPDGTFSYSEQFEKFAELIVLECAGVTLDYKNDDYYNGWCDHSAEILEHFGVK